MDHRFVGPANTELGLEPDNPLMRDAPIAIYTVDLDGVVLSWNRAAEQLFGWTAEEAIGQRAPFVPSERVGEVLAARDQLVAGEPINAMEYRPVTRDGNYPTCRDQREPGP